MKIIQEALAVYLTQEFTMPQAELLAQVISDSYVDLVKTSDFDELKAIVERIAVAQEHLTVAQEHTGKRLDALTEAQLRSEQRIGTLETAVAELVVAVRATTEAVQALTHKMDQTRTELAGLGKSFGYALENEAYRVLPGMLDKLHRIEVKDRFVRTFVGEREINLLAEGEQDGEPVLIVGETKAQLGTDDLRQLDESVAAVRAAQAAGELPAGRIVRLWVTHLARPAAKKRAEALGMLVIESFSW